MDERETFVRRTLTGTAAVGVAGVVILLLLGRGAWALAFGVGAAVTLGNFHLIVRAVRGLEAPEAGRASRRLWKGALFRFAMVGAALVVAVAILRLHFLALLAGLLVTQLAMVGYWLTRSFSTPE